MASTEMNTEFPSASPSEEYLGSRWSSINVVCVAYNNAETVVPLLNSLILEAAQISEVIIHDNGSSDDTVTVAKRWMSAHPGVNWQVVAADNIGFSAGVFAASQRLSDTELPTLCLNPDAILSPGTVKTLLEVLNIDSAVGIATVPLVMADGQIDPSCVRTLPKFGSSILYSILGKFLPARFRYNAAKLEDINSHAHHAGEISYKEIQATTGALMLVNPMFRPSSRPIFDLDYWMYGEDLQLCKDAADEGYIVVIADHEPSVHLKGVSSGWPRSTKSNKAFHEALFLYFLKNFSKGPLDRFIGDRAIQLRLAVTELAAKLEHLRRNITKSL